MSQLAHLEQLNLRHRALDQEIQEAQKHPSTDSLTLRALKRKKLALKEEIEKLRSSAQFRILH